MRPLSTTLFAPVWLPILVTAGAAQSPTIRVRITSEVGRTVGLLAAMTADSAYLLDRQNGFPTPIFVGSTTRFEISRGRSSRVGKGALYGFLTGAAVAGLKQFNSCNRGACSNQLLPAIAVSSVVGVAAGSIAGTLFRVERWEPIAASTLAATALRQDSALAVVATSRWRHTATGLLAGVGLGAAASLALVQRSGFESSGFDARPVIVIAGGIGGGILGTIVGSLIRTTPRAVGGLAIQPHLDGSITGAMSIGVTTWRAPR